MLRDALREMILAYRQLGKEIPSGSNLLWLPELRPGASETA